MTDDEKYKKFITRNGRRICRPTDNYKERIFDDLNEYNLGWFTIAESLVDQNKLDFELKKEIPVAQDLPIKSKQVHLYLTTNQKKCIDRWLNTCIIMYNKTLAFIRTSLLRDFFSIRKNLKQTKDFFKSKSKSKPFDLEIPTHIIDASIKEAVTNYKESEKRAKDRLYYKKEAAKAQGIELTEEEQKLEVGCKDKFFMNEKKIMHIEGSFFAENSYILQILEGGKFEYKHGKKWEKFDLTKINKTSILQKNGNKYYLYVPELDDSYEKWIKVKKTEVKDTDNIIKKKKDCYKVIPTNKNPHNTEETIVGDLGKRKFLTCYSPSQREVIKIGEGCADEIEKYIIRENKINEILSNKSKYNLSINSNDQDEITKKKIKRKVNKLKKNKKLCKRKIENKTDEIHWKTINFLTNNFKNIIIGDFKIGSVLRSNTLPKKVKNVMKRLRYGAFKLRLKFKCNLRKCGLRYVSEYNSSKRCSRCGTINKNLGGSEVYKCINETCGYEEDRDVNSDINLFMHHFAK